MVTVLLIVTNNQFRAELDLFRVHVELLPPHGDLFVSLRGFTAKKKKRNIHQVTVKGVVLSSGYCLFSKSLFLFI